MRKFDGLCAAVILLLSAVPAAAQPNCAALKKFGTIKLIQEGNGVWFAPVFVNGVRKEFALSLGAGESGISQSVIDELHLKTRTKPQIAFKIPSDYAHVDSLILDKVGQLTDTDLIVLQGNGRGGILALDILTRFDFDVDFVNGTLSLFDSNHCDGQVVYWTSAAAVGIPFVYDGFGVIRFPVLLGDQSIPTRFNTLTPINGMNAVEATQKLYFKKGEATALPDPGKNLHAYQVTYPSLGFGGLRLANPAYVIFDQVGDIPVTGEVATVFPRMQLERMFATNKMPPSNYIGLNTLAKLHIYVASKEKKLYITPASVPAQ